MTEFKTFKIDDEYIEQNDIVRRYLQNNLTPEETVEFEEYILDKPELLERLELDMVLVETLPKAITNKTKLTSSSIWKKLFGTPMRASIGTVTACAMAAILFLNLQVQQLTPIKENIELVYLSHTRGAPIQQIEYSTNLDTLIFILQLDSEQGTQFKVRLFNQDTEKKIPLLANYTANEMGDIYIPTRVQELVKGSYLFEYYPVGEELNKQTTPLQIN